jgi:multiple sugar transport system ATP-binding protein
MATVAYVGASRLYPGSDTPAVDRLDLDIADGEFLVLVGPSGSGKSTALRMLAGLEDVDAGEIRIDGQDVSDAAPKDRDIAMVFQNYALYPHMTVGDNMGFALKLAGTPKTEIAERVRKAAEMLDLAPFLDRKPRALSGGQRQRVAMGRAIVRSPRVFLMDEPLSNLDAKLRVQTRAEIANLQRDLNTTTVYVTHDQTEAMTMGHRVAVLRDGLLQQVATPRELYEAPANVFVAGFIGSPAMNIFRAPVTPEGASVGGHTVPLTRDRLAQLAGATSADVGIRPESLDLSAEPTGLRMHVRLVEELGADAYLHGTTAHGGEDHPLVVRVDGRRPPVMGSDVDLTVRAGEVHLFHPETGVRLS